MAPPARERTTFHEKGNTDAGAIVDRITFDAEEETLHKKIKDKRQKIKDQRKKEQETRKKKRGRSDYLEEESDKNYRE